MAFKKIVFIPTPVVVKTIHKPSTQCCVEYSQNKREFKSLFAEFSANKFEVERRRLASKINSLRCQTQALFKRASVMKRTDHRSFAAVALKGAKSQGYALTSLPTPPPPRRETLVSRYWARRDYTRAFKEQEQQRQAALELVRAIAARHTRHVRRVITDEEMALRNKRLAELRSLQKRSKFLRSNKGKEVLEMPEGNYTPIEQEEIVGVEPLIKGVVQATSKKQFKIKNPILTTFADIANQVKMGKRVLFKSKLDKELILFLKFKIRLVIQRFRDPLGVELFLERRLREANIPQPQMDDVGIVQSTPTPTNQKSNVIIMESGINEVGNTPPVLPGMSELAMSLQTQSISTYTDRWIHFKTIDWTDSNSQNTELPDSPFELPQALFKDKKDLQLVKMFFMNKFYRFKTMKFKFVLNSSPWMTGMVVADWCYGLKDDTSGWRNVYTALQRNHIKLSAGSSNNAILDVPYHNFNSFLSTDTNQSVLGCLSIHVLNKLMTNDSVTKTARISIFVAFEGFEGHGMISPKIAENDVVNNSGIQGQMQTIGELCNLGSNVLSAAGKLVDRDNPPIPLNPPYFIPQSTGSFSYTDGTPEPVHMLRADSRGQRPGIFGTDEMDPTVIARKWGFLRTEEWHFTDSIDTQICSLPVEPISPPYYSRDSQALSFYPGLQTMTPGIYKCVYPPVALVSSLAAYWRGSLEYMFEVVGNQSYTGSLIISSVPLDKIDKQRKIADLVSSTYTILDIQQETQVVKVVPWNWYNPWARTRRLDGKSNSIARLYCVVLNPLIGISQVPTSVRVNVYIRAGLDFEVSLIRTPLLSTPTTGALVPPKTEYLHPYNLEDKQYMSYVGSVGYQDKYHLIAYVQNVVNGWCGYLSIEPNIIYTVENTSLGYPWRIRAKTVQSKDTEIECKWGVYHPRLTTKNAKGLVLFTSLEAAKKFRDLITRLDPLEASKQFFESTFGPANQYYAYGSWSQCKFDYKNWKTCSNQPGNWPLWVPVNKSIGESFEIVEAQMDTRGIIINAEETTASTNQGLKTFGEKFPSLKGVARRWQHYESFKGKTCTAKVPRDCPPVVKFSVQPKREGESVLSASYDNRIRDGSITLLNSLFYTWDGSMRYRFVFTGTIKSGTTVYIQYKFDQEMAILGTESINKISVSSDLMDPHYPTAVQSLDVNPIVTIEIPYYQTYERLLTTATSSRPYSNGQIYVYIHSEDSQDIDCDIYMSVGDDFQWSVFQGCPRMMDLAQFTAEPQMEQAGVEANGFLDLFKKEREAAVELTATAQETCESVKKTSDNLNKVLESIKQIPEMLSKEKTDQKQFVNSASFSEMFGGDILRGSFDFLTHIVYICMNPNGRTVAWGIVNILRNIFGLPIKSLIQLTGWIGSLWESVTSPTQQPQEMPKPQMDDSDIPSICSVLFCTFCTAAKMAIEPPTEWKDIAKGLFNFSNTCKGASLVGKFINDNITLLKRVFNKFVNIFSFKKNNYKIISGLTDVRLKTWLLHSTALIHPSIQEKILNNSIWAEKVLELGIVGRAISLTLDSFSDVTWQVRQVFKTNLSAIIKIETSLVNRKIFSSTKYDPFCLWIAGGAGSGKSRYLEWVAEEFAEHYQYSTVQPYHTITSGQAYFDGYIGQPTIFIDDYYTASTATDPTVTMFCQMKGPCLFNPPFSAVEDKCRLVNFQNLFVSSNFLGADNWAGIHDRDAHNRRRSLLLQFKARKQPEGFKEFTKEQILKYYEQGEHFDAYLVPNPLDFNSNHQLIKREEGRSYRLTVLDLILKYADQYHDAESACYQLKIKKQFDRIKAVSGDGKCLEDYLKEFDSIITEQHSLGDQLVSPIKNWLNADRFTEIDARKRLLNTVTAEVHIGDMKNLEDVDKKVEDTVEKLVTPKDDDKPEPQGADDALTWPACVEGKIIPSGFTDWRSLENGVLVEPKDRKPVGCGDATFSNGCLHALAEDLELYEYDKVTKTYTLITVTESIASHSFSFPAGQCYIKTGSVLTPNPLCLFETAKLRKKFMGKLFSAMLKQQPFASQLDILKSDEVPEELKRMVSNINSEIESIIDTDYTKFRMRPLVDFQCKFNNKFEMIGEQPLPKESPKKSIPAKVWSCFLKFCSVMYKIICMVHTIIGTLLGGFFLVGLCATAYGAYNGYNNSGSGNSPPPPQGNLHPSGDFSTLKAARSFRKNIIRLTEPNGQAESIIEGEVTNDHILSKENLIFHNPSENGMLHKIVSNSITLTGISKLDNGNSILYRSRCLGLFGRTFLVLRHYIEHFKNKGVDEVAIVFHKHLGVIRFKISELTFKWTEGGYGTCTLPSMPGTFKDIRKLMPSENMTTFPRRMYMVEPTAESMNIFELEVTQLRSDIEIPSTNGQSAWVIKDGFSYSWGGKGKCGSFLFAPGMACPLVGIHTAGIGVIKGFAEPLNKETFVTENAKIDVTFVTPQMDYNDGGFQIPGDALVCGHVPQSKAVALATKTKIEESEIHGVFPVETAPAPLTGSDPRLSKPINPLVVGIEKRCDKPIEFNETDLNTAQEDFTNMIEVNVSAVRNVSVLSVSEAVCGLLLPGYDPMVISTSEGYPWILERPKDASNKSWMFNFEERPTGRELVGIYSKLMNTIKVKEQMREHLIVPATYFTSCLKDARIPIYKIPEPGKTRVFEMSPVDFTISQRQYFLDFYVAYQTARMNAENTIGINPDGPEWTELANRLQEFSPHILTADYSAYGPRLLHSVILRAKMAELNWYEQEEERVCMPEEERERNFKIRYTMIEELINPLNIVKDCIVRFNTGMPSGNAGTVITNSECNSIYIRCAYLGLARKYAPVLADLYWFKQYVRMFSNGDDLIMAVKPDIISWFNNRTLIEFFSQHNIKMTDALKSGKVREFCSLEEATYLKRGFKKHPTRPGEWLAPLERASITDTANWIWRSVDRREASLVNSEMSCRLAYTHGPEFYAYVCAKLKKAWRKLRVEFDFPSWTSLDSHVWEGTEGPKFNF